MRDGGIVTTYMILITTSLEYMTKTLVVLGTISLRKKRVAHASTSGTTRY